MTRLEQYIAEQRAKMTTRNSSEDDAERSWQKLRRFQIISSSKGNDNETYLHRYLNGLERS